MFRLIVLVLLRSLVAACTSTTPAPPLSARTATDPTTERLTIAPVEPVPIPPVPQTRGQYTDDYMMIKGGFYEPDSGSLDDGYIVNFAFGHYFTQFLALELEIGYLDSEETPASLVDTIFVGGEAKYYLTEDRGSGCVRGLRHPRRAVLGTEPTFTGNLPGTFGTLRARG